MNDALKFITGALATYRVTKLVLDDEIFAAPRNKLLTRFPPHTSKIGFGLTCPYCVSVWAGVAIAAAHVVAPKTTFVVTSGLAYSALTGEAYNKL